MRLLMFLSKKHPSNQRNSNIKATKRQCVLIAANQIDKVAYCSFSGGESSIYVLNLEKKIERKR